MKVIYIFIALSFISGCTVIKVTDLEITSVNRVSFDEMYQDAPVFISNQRGKLKQLPSDWAIRVSFQSRTNIRSLNNEYYDLKIKPNFCARPYQAALLSLGHVYSKNKIVSPFESINNEPISMDKDGYFRFYGYVLSAHPWPNLDSYTVNPEKFEKFEKFNLNYKQEDICIKLRGTQYNIFFNRYTDSNEVKIEESTVRKLAGSANK